MRKNKQHKMTFEQAVKETEDVHNGYQPGLLALKAYANKIRVPNPSKIGGSLDIDGTTKCIYPNDYRWDYAICYDGEVFYIEVHSAITSEVAKMINKLNWIKNWLSTKAPKINKLTTKSKRPYYWVQSSNYAIPKHTSQYRKIVQNKILPMAIWDYSKI